MLEFVSITHFFFSIIKCPIQISIIRSVEFNIKTFKYIRSNKYSIKSPIFLCFSSLIYSQILFLNLTRIYTKIKRLKPIYHIIFNNIKQKKRIKNNFCYVADTESKYSPSERYKSFTNFKSYHFGFNSIEVKIIPPHSHKMRDHNFFMEVPLYIKNIYKS